ncbi:TPA: ATP synthase subunit I [Staphylococcus aureus]
MNRIDTTNRLYYHLVCMSGTVFMIDISHTEAYKMSRFYNIFKQFIQYYFYLIIILGGLYLYTHHAFILGLIIGVTGSAINTCIFECYLAKAKRPDTMHISTGNMWRYLVAIIACMIWYLNKAHVVSIIGIIIGLMISYVVVIIRPLLKVSK